MLRRHIRIYYNRLRIQSPRRRNITISPSIATTDGNMVPKCTIEPNNDKIDWVYYFDTNARTDLLKPVLSKGKVPIPSLLSTTLQNHPSIMNNIELSKLIHNNKLDGYQEFLNALEKDNKLFPLNFVLELTIDLLKESKFVKIHKIYMLYKECLPIYKQNNQVKYYKFIEIMIRVESYLRNHAECENLFIEYIQAGTVKGDIISLGLKSLVERKKFQLAKELYVQFLQNEEMFPMTSKELHLLLKNFYKYNDFSHMKFVFSLWNKFKCGPESLVQNQPSLNTISLMHKMFILFDDTSGLSDFLNLECVRKTEYEGSLAFELTIFYQELYANKAKFQNQMSALNREELHTKTDEFLERINRDTDARFNFYSSILKAFIFSNDITSIKLTLEKILKDDTILMLHSEKLQENICLYFTKNGLFKELLQYYKQQKNTNNLVLNEAIFTQLWDCYSTAYPMVSHKSNLIRLKKIYDLSKKREDLSWFKQLFENYAQHYGQSIDTDLTDTYYLETSKRFDSIMTALKCNDIKNAQEIILDSVREGFVSYFSFYYAILKKCLEMGPKGEVVARLADDILRKTFHYTPLKLDILWLKYSVVNLRRKSRNQFDQSEKSRIADSKITAFITSCQTSLNFQNYLQLSNIYVKLNNYGQAKLLVNKARKLASGSNEPNAMVYVL